MSKLFRGSVIFAGLMIGLSQIAFAGGMMNQQDPAASSETSKAAKSQIKKKTKKKKASNTSFVIVGTYASQRSVEAVVLPNASSNITPVVDPNVTPRQVVTANKIPALHVLPIEDPPAAVATAGQLVISEFRVRGANGMNDEFIEIANVSGADHTVAALSGTGYGVAASDGVTRCSIPNGTVIPNKGHYLCVNNNAPRDTASRLIPQAMEPPPPAMLPTRLISRTMPVSLSSTTTLAAERIR